MYYHFIAFSLGIILDLIIGDPQNFPHPIRLMGGLISFLDRKLLKERHDKNSELLLGTIMWFIVVFLTILASLSVIVLSYGINIYLGVLVEAILTCYILAAKSLEVESMKVYRALTDKTLKDAREAVSMIVGRDTGRLDESGVIRAVVETIAENTSDGVIAPLIFTFVGGPALGFFYKAVNTMDSMVGYHNDRYEYFGRFAAKMDDLFNFFPSRLSGLLMVMASFIGGRDYSARGAMRIFKRDRFNHKSPNSAQTESACAGALLVRLAGPTSYFGKMVNKPYIGDDTRPIDRDDIRRTIKLMYITEALAIMMLAVIAAVIIFVDSGV